MTRNEYEYPEAYGALSSAFVSLLSSSVLALESYARALEEFKDASDVDASAFATLTNASFGPIYHLESGIQSALEVNVETNDPGDEIPAVIARDQFIRKMVGDYRERAEAAIATISRLS